MLDKVRSVSNCGKFIYAIVYLITIGNFNCILGLIHVFYCLTLFPFIVELYLLFCI